MQGCLRMTGVPQSSTYIFIISSNFARNNRDKTIVIGQLSPPITFPSKSPFGHLSRTYNKPTLAERLNLDRPTMSPTTTMFRAARPIFQQSSRAAFRSQFARTSGRRFQSTTSGGQGPTAQQQQSWFNRMMESPVGFKTVHFW